MKARHDQSVTTGWWAGFISQVKEVKTPHHWLNPVTPKAKKAAGASNVMAMFKRKAAKKPSA